MPITISKFDAVTAHLGGGIVSGSVPIDFLSDTIKVSLHTSTYTPVVATHDFFDDVTNEVAAGSGYTASGETLASKTVAVATGVATYDAADITWTFTAGVSWRYGVIYKSTGTASTSPLMWLLDWQTTQTVSTPYTLTWAATGIFTVT